MQIILYYLAPSQSIQNGTQLYFGISVTDAETGTNIFYRDKDGAPGTPADKRYYRRDSLEYPMGKLLIWALENILPPSITGLVVEKL